MSSYDDDFDDSEREDADLSDDQADDRLLNFRPVSIADSARAAMDTVYAAWRTESPIEGLLASALTPRILANGGLLLFQHQIIAGTQVDQPQLRLTLQEQRGEYRVDFELAYHPRGGPLKTMVIECDGHEFHDRSVEQATRDRRRDRRFLAEGTPTFRFTGWEITRNAGACADEIMKFWESCTGRRWPWR
jgi:very-short-patch-repair endonuclease